MATDPTLPEWVRVARAIPPSQPAPFNVAAVQAARQSLPPGAVAQGTARFFDTQPTKVRGISTSTVRGMPMHGYRAPRPSAVTVLDGSVVTPPLQPTTVVDGSTEYPPAPYRRARPISVRDGDVDMPAPRLPDGVEAFNPGRYGTDLRSQVYGGRIDKHGARAFSNNPFAPELGADNTRGYAAHASLLQRETDTERAMQAARAQAARLAPQNFGDVLKAGANARADRASVRDEAMAEIEREQAAYEAFAKNPWNQRRATEFERLNAMTPAQRVSELGPSAANPQTAADIAMALAMIDARVNPDTLPSGKAGLNAIAANLAGQVNQFQPLHMSTWYDENLATGANDILDYNLVNDTLEGPIGGKGGRRRVTLSDADRRLAFGGRDPRQLMEALRIARGNNPDYVPQRIADRKYVQD